MWVIHLRTDHVQHRHAYLRRSTPVFGPCEGQPTLLTIQLARKLPLAVTGHRSVTGQRSSYEGESARSLCLVPDKRDNGVVATGASGRHEGQSEVGFLSVSYTHLTLPTILRV